MPQLPIARSCNAHCLIPATGYASCGSLRGRKMSRYSANWKNFPLPGDSRNQELGLTVHEVSSAITPPYAAVSYTWGIASPADSEINLAGNPHKVRQNLYEFLKRTRASRSINSFWIDALCINQEDAVEKNAHVAIMGHVFAEASALTVWLGVSDGDSDYFMQIMEKGDSETFVSPKLPEPASLSPRFINSLFELCGRPYWHRMWVIQEFALATVARSTFKKVVLETKVTYDENGRDVYDSELWPPMTASGKCLEIFLSSRMFNIITIRARGFRFVRRPLGNLIQSFYTYDCEDLRDKVYALLGIANDVQRAWDRGHQVLLPDYNKDPLDLLLEVLKFCGSDIEGFTRPLVGALTSSEKEELEWNHRLTTTTNIYQKEAGEEGKYQERLKNFRLAGTIAESTEVSANVNKSGNVIVRLDGVGQAAAVVRENMKPLLIANSAVHQRRIRNSKAVI